MANLTIKGMPDGLYERLKASAARSRRSINAEVIVRLEQALGAGPVGLDELDRRLQAFRERVGGYASDDEVDRWKRAGRE